MKQIIVLFLIIFSHCLLAQYPTIKHLKTPLHEPTSTATGYYYKRIGNNILLDQNNNSYSVHTATPKIGETDRMIVKTDPTGVVIDSIRLGNIEYSVDIAYNDGYLFVSFYTDKDSVFVLSDGNYTVFNKPEESNTHYSGLFKFDQNGVLVEEQIFANKRFYGLDVDEGLVGCYGQIKKDEIISFNSSSTQPVDSTFSIDHHFVEFFDLEINYSKHFTARGNIIPAECDIKIIHSRNQFLLFGSSQENKSTFFKFNTNNPNTNTYYAARDLSFYVSSFDLDGNYQWHNYAGNKYASRYIQIFDYEVVGEYLYYLSTSHPTYVYHNSSETHHFQQGNYKSKDLCLRKINLNTGSGLLREFSGDRSRRFNFSMTSDLSIIMTGRITSPILANDPVSSFGSRSYTETTIAEFDSDLYVKWYATMGNSGIGYANEIDHEGDLILHLVSSPSNPADADLSNSERILNEDGKFNYYVKYGLGNSIKSGTWTGLGDGIHWGDPLNWVGDIVPGATDKVYLDNSNVAGNYNVQIAADASVDYLEIDNANVSLNINQNISLSYDSIVNNGNIVLEDGASLLPNSANTGLISGTDFTIKRDRPSGLTASFYNFWSSPVNNGNSSMLVGGRNIYSLALGADDDNSHWQSFTGAMTNGRSYAATHVNQAVFTGTPNNGTVLFAVEDNTASGDGNINMVGNPYPSAISAAEFVNDNAGILQDATLHLWAQVVNNTKNVASNFVAVNNTGPSHPGQRNQTLANTDIASCQGFQVLVAANGNVRFENDQRNGNNSGFKSGTDRTLKNAQKLWMAVEQNSIDVHTLVAFGEQATQGIDFYYDAQDKLSKTQLQINSINKGRHFKINALPLSVEDYMVPLSVTVSKGDFSLYCSDTLNFSKYQSVFLRDRETNQQYKLSKGEKIHFSNTEANSWQDRFYLMFLEKATGVTDAETLKTAVHYHVGQEGLTLSSIYQEDLQIQVVNSLGQLLGAYNLLANGELNLDLQPGFYIIHVSNVAYSTTLKIKL